MQPQDDNLARGLVVPKEAKVLKNNKNKKVLSVAGGRTTMYCWSDLDGSPVCNVFIGAPANIRLLCKLNGRQINFYAFEIKTLHELWVIGKGAPLYGE